MQVQLKVNNRQVSVDVPPHTLLVQVLREHLHMTGTHVACSLNGLGRSHGSSTLLHSFDDVLVARAAAHVAFEVRTDLLCAGIGVLGAQVDSAQHHARGAKTALQAVAVFKCRLHWVHGSVRRGQTFDGGDLGAICLSGQDVARFNGMAVLDHRACAALCGVATYMGTGHM